MLCLYELHLTNLKNNRQVEHRGPLMVNKSADWPIVLHSSPTDESSNWAWASALLPTAVSLPGAVVQGDYSKVLGTSLGL